MTLDLRVLWKSSAKTEYKSLNEKYENMQKSVGKRTKLWLNWHGIGHDDITNMRQVKEKFK